MPRQTALPINQNAAKSARDSQVLGSRARLPVNTCIVGGMAGLGQIARMRSTDMAIKVVQGALDDPIRLADTGRGDACHQSHSRKVAPHAARSVRSM